jgi:hypothetical protein
MFCSNEYDSVATRLMHVSRQRMKQRITEELLTVRGRQSSVEEKIPGRESQGAWRKDELIGGKPTVVK